MAKGLWRSTFIGGFIAWLWMAISWMVLPWHCSVMDAFPKEEEAVKVIAEQTPTSGIYTAPSMCGGKGVQEGTPQIFLSINKSGVQKGMVPFVISLITYFLGALLIALVIMQMAPTTYGWKLFSVAMIGLSIGVLSEFPEWNWWGIPFNYAFMMTLDHFISWFLAGLVIAAFIHPKHHRVDR